MTQMKSREFQANDGIDFVTIKTAEVLLLPKLHGTDDFIGRLVSKRSGNNIHFMPGFPYRIKQANGKTFGATLNKRGLYGSNEYSHRLDLGLYAIKA